MLFVFRNGSSVLFVIASSVRLPLVDLFLNVDLISGPAYAKFSVFDAFALVALVVRGARARTTAPARAHARALPARSSPS